MPTNFKLADKSTIERKELLEGGPQKPLFEIKYRDDECGTETTLHLNSWWTAGNDKLL